MNNYVTSAAGKFFIESFEEKRRVQYICPAGKLTIGYGHVIQAGEYFKQPMSDNDINALFAKDLMKFETAVRKWIKVPLNQNQFDAIVSFLFNEGADALNPNTDTWTALNVRKNYQEFAEDLLKWNKALDPKTKKLVVLDGLTRRRQDEKKLFLTPVK